MPVKFSKPRGTQDVLPTESWKWQWIEDQLRIVARLFGYEEIRLPTFEATELFSRGVGETTDIVAKEMYTFEDKGGRSVTLRPEGTAGVVRAVLENGLLAASPLPLKSYYMQSCFRYEKAQKGRLREFHQFGIECFGPHTAAADIEAMAVADTFYKRCGVRESITLEINSIGCPTCRAEYYKELKQYFEKYKSSLCETCVTRLDKTPMRILDCKEERCKAIAKNAPVILDYLCDNCRVHFEEVRMLLEEATIAYVVNPHIVRGLDYYTDTVFEFVAEGVGTQGTVCAGGRYDGLIEALGGQPMPAVGFGMGIERSLMLLEEQGKLPPPPSGPLVYAIAADEMGRVAARKLTILLRDAGIEAECDIANRSVKAQMKAAGRLGAVFTVVLGETEVVSDTAMLKRMADGYEKSVVLGKLLATLRQE